MMAGVHRLSEVVYHCVNAIIGCREAVIMRRDIWDIENLLHNSIDLENAVMMMSGSRREGFDMESSDYDIMTWSQKHHVICDSSQVNLYNISAVSVILMEDKYTKPGFVLLRILNEVVSNHQLQALVTLNNYYYIGSFMFRKTVHSTCSPVTFLSNSTIHGPCSSGFFADQEYDFAVCFASKHWPPQAYHWIERCKRQRWPSLSVLRNIIHSGCHFMSIGSKNSPTELIEWRLSFSQAEQKLVYSMNHCQFLVYGLLKLFLKEVLNKGISEDNKLMCSYFMKTAVFWEIQNNVSIPWNTENFLSCFWRCYKCLVKWVYSGYCPNFFVPQNNMFYPKITGSRQQRLLYQLLDLYSEGLPCLLRCSSVNNKLLSAISNPQQSVINTDLNFSEFDHDVLRHMLLHDSYCVSEVNSVYQKYEKIRTFYYTKLNPNMSQVQRVMVYRYVIRMYQHLAFLLQTNHIHITNTEMYAQRKQSVRLMEMTTKNGCVTDVLCLAIYHYIDGRYKQTLCLLQEAQARLYKPYVMYLTVNKYCYIMALCGKSMREKIKASMACNIVLPAFIKFPELILELSVSNEGLIVPPFILLHFLFFLCHYHLKCVQQQQQSLHALHILMHWSEGRYASSLYKDIAWQMLGICHQLSKHPSQALECYLEAQRYSPYNEIQQAALYRIQTVERQVLIQNSSLQY